MRKTHLMQPSQTKSGRFAYLDDEQLVLGALVGDMEAFDELAQRFRGAVTAVALGVLGSREAAEDVAQEALLLAFKALPQLEDHSKFAGWLCAIARHRARRRAAMREHSAAAWRDARRAHKIEMCPTPRPTLPVPPASMIAPSTIASSTPPSAAGSGR